MASVSRIQHNIPAMNSFTNYTNNTKALTKNIQKLSSGYRINSAADDAAGLAISEKMRSQIKGLEKAQDNCNDGISLIQTAEGALTEVNSMLTRLTELATQSANGVYEDAVDRENIQAEAEALVTEIDRISQSTNFNGINLLDGSMSASTTTAFDVSTLKAGDHISFGGETYTFVPGTGAKPKLKGAVSATMTTEKAATSTQAGKYSFTLPASKAQVTSGNGTLEVKIGTGTSYKIEINGEMTDDELGKAIADKINSSLKVDSAIYSASYNADNNKLTLTTNTIAGTAAALASGTELTIAASGAAVTGVYGENSFANASSFASLLTTAGFTTAAAASGSTLVTVSGKNLKLQVGDTNSSFQKVSVDIRDMSATGLGLRDLDLSTQETAGEAISVIKAAVNKVSAQRGDLGALQNRLDYTLNNLAATTENITASESQIRDVDMAKEMTAYSKNNILVQAAQSMLAQANSLPQGVLQLLQ